jgi:hypothetical protein
MTKKELYKLSVAISGNVLRDYFDAPSTNFSDMESTKARKKARAGVYSLLSLLLLDQETK